MPLRQINLQLSYRTGRGDMVKGLLVPCLEQSILYRRAAGYFTSFGLGLGDKSFFDPNAGLLALTKTSA